MKCDSFLGAAAMDQKLKAASNEAEALDAEAGRKLPGAGKLRSAIAERERKMEGLLKRMHEIEDRIFAAFSEKVGPERRTLLGAVGRAGLCCKPGCAKSAPYNHSCLYA